MHTKNNNNKTRNFVQGLRPFSSSIPRTLKKHLRKNGFNYSSDTNSEWMTKADLQGWIDFNKNLPKKDDEIEFDKFFIKILSMNDNRIDNVFFKQNTK